jgi:hypothetical protein
MLLLDDKQLEHRGTKVSRFDVATTWLMATTEDADAKELEIRTRARLKWSRGQMSFADDEHGNRTHYWVALRKGKRVRRQLALYRKGEDRREVRLELRFCTTDMCKRQGVTRPRDVLDLDPARLFDKHVAFADPDAIESHVSKVVRKTVQEDIARYRNVTTTHPVTDRCRAALPRMLRAQIARAGQDRIQNIRQRLPRLKLRPISQSLDIPNKLTWKSSGVITYTDAHFLKNNSIKSRLDFPTSTTPDSLESETV